MSYHSTKSVMPWKTDFLKPEYGCNLQGYCVAWSEFFLKSFAYKNFLHLMHGV